MLAVISLISGILAGLCWLVWALGGGEYSGRVVWVAIIATITCIVSATISKVLDEEVFGY